MTKKKEAQEEQKKKNLLEFSLNLSDEEDSYYTLIGYDDGLISTAKKQINNLFDEYKTLYFWLFKIPLPKGTIQPIAGISAFFLIRNIVPPFIFNGIDWTSMAGLGIGGVTWLLSNKAYNFFFPFSDFQINRPRKNIILKSSVGLILVGLIVNLIWEIIKLLF